MLSINSLEKNLANLQVRVDGLKRQIDAAKKNQQNHANTQSRVFKNIASFEANTILNFEQDLQNLQLNADRIIKQIQSLKTDETSDSLNDLDVRAGMILKSIQMLKSDADIGIHQINLEHSQLIPEISEQVIEPQVYHSSQSNIDHPWQELVVGYGHLVQKASVYQSAIDRLTTTVKTLSTIVPEIELSAFVGGIDQPDAQLLSQSESFSPQALQAVLVEPMMIELQIIGLALERFNTSDLNQLTSESRKAAWEQLVTVFQQSMREASVLGVVNEPSYHTECVVLIDKFKVQQATLVAEYPDDSFCAVLTEIEPSLSVVSNQLTGMSSRPIISEISGQVIEPQVYHSSQSNIDHPWQDLVVGYGHLVRKASVYQSAIDRLTTTVKTLSTIVPEIELSAFVGGIDQPDAQLLSQSESFSPQALQAVLVEPMTIELQIIGLALERFNKSDLNQLTSESRKAAWEQLVTVFQQSMREASVLGVVNEPSYHTECVVLIDKFNVQQARLAAEYPDDSFCAVLTEIEPSLSVVSNQLEDMSSRPLDSNVSNPSSNSVKHHNSGILSPIPGHERAEPVGNEAASNKVSERSSGHDEHGEPSNENPKNASSQDEKQQSIKASKKESFEHKNSPSDYKRHLLKIGFGLFDQFKDEYLPNGLDLNLISPTPKQSSVNSSAYFKDNSQIGYQHMRMREYDLVRSQCIFSREVGGAPVVGTIYQNSDGRVINGSKTILTSEEKSQVALKMAFISLINYKPGKGHIECYSCDPELATKMYASLLYLKDKIKVIGDPKIICKSAGCKKPGIFQSSELFFKEHLPNADINIPKGLEKTAEAIADDFKTIKKGLANMKNNQLLINDAMTKEVKKKHGETFVVDLLDKPSCP